MFCVDGRNMVDNRRMNPAMTDARYRRFVISFIVVLGIALYAHTLPFPFQFDGILYIEGNPLITSYDYFEKMWNFARFTQLDEQLGLPADLTTNFLLRPVSYFSFFLDYCVSGLNPVGYRAINIAIHCANAVLVYLFLAMLVQRTVRETFSRRFIPTAAAFFFLIHPVQIQCVTYIAQRFTSLVATMYLLTLILYLCSVDAENRRKASLFRWASVVALILGMLVKESMFTAPVMLLLLETVVLGSTVKTAFRRTVLHLLCLPLLPVLIVLTEAAQSASRANMTDALNIVNYGSYPPAQYAITQICVVTTYLRLLFLPYGQNIDPDYPLFTSLLNGRVMLSLAVLLVFLSASLIYFRQRKREGRSRLILFGTLWFFLVNSISSSIVPLPDLMAEQRIYLPSMGIFLVLFTLVDLVRTRWVGIRHGTGIVVGVVVWGVVLCGLTFARNEVWRTRTSLWEDSVGKSPLKGRPWHNLGQSYLEQGRYREAVPYFQQSLSLDRFYFMSFIGLSAAYDELELFNEAIDVCSKGLAIDPVNAELYHNMGIAQARLGKWREAEQSLLKAVELRPKNSGDHISMAKLYYFTYRYAAALQECRIAARLSPPDRQLLLMMEVIERLLPHSK